MKSHAEIMRECLLIILIMVFGSVHAAKITVGHDNEDYLYIQQAIDNASIKDIVEVHSGIYRENLQVFKSITLIGVDTGKGLPVINASGSGSVVTLLGNGSTIEGFNLTGSGHCGCGNAGIAVMGNDNLVKNNVLYRNKYGIFIQQLGFVNNTFIANDFLQNEIDAYDWGGNRWNSSQKTEGLQVLFELLRGKQMKGNHYSDYDKPEEGCNDTNNDRICDQPRAIDGGSSLDLYPSVVRGDS